MPSRLPSYVPSVMPSFDPSRSPSSVPSTDPSSVPSLVPSVIPSTLPSVAPSLKPSFIPSDAPSMVPSKDSTISNRKLHSIRFFKGDILLRSIPFDDLRSQRELSRSRFDCVSLPIIHNSDPHFINMRLKHLLEDTENLVGENAFKPEVRKLGPEANLVVWDSEVVSAESHELLMNKRLFSVWNSSMALVDSNFGLVEPSRWEAQSLGKVLDGDFVVFHIFSNGDYVHLLLYHLPLLAWMDQEVVEKDTKFILIDLPGTKAVMSKLDPDFYENRLVWINPGDAFHVTGTLTVAMPISFPTRGFMRNLVFWLRSLNPEPVFKDKIIYFSQNFQEVSHGRKMDPENEEKAIAVIRQKISQQLGRSGDELIIFNGLKENGQQISFEEQFDLFSTAQTIIGPHGGGLANIVWSAVHPSMGCSHRTQILEFLSSRSLYTSFHGLPIDHHVIYFSKQSTLSTTLIGIRDLTDALDTLWQQKPPKKNPY